MAALSREPRKHTSYSDFLFFNQPIRFRPNSGRRHKVLWDFVSRPIVESADIRRHTSDGTILAWSQVSWFMPRAVIGVYHMVQVFCPTWYLGLWQGAEDFQECPVVSLNLTVPLEVLWGCTRMFHATQLLQLLVEAVFKFSPLIMMNRWGKTKSENKIIVKFVGNCLSWLFTCGIGLGIACKMIHHN